jgi:hypothetical protein
MNNGAKLGGIKKSVNRATVHQINLMNLHATLKSSDIHPLDGGIVIVIEVIEDRDLGIALLQQSFNGVRADKSGSACD